MSRVIDIISRIRQLDGQFCRREQQVADYMLSHLEEIGEMSQNDIAEASGVSVATVNRFCNTLGCEGFRDFRITLAQSVAVSLQYLGGPSRTSSPAGQLLMQVFGPLVDTLHWPDHSWMTMRCRPPWTCWPTQGA